MTPDALDEVVRLETEADGCPDCGVTERRDGTGRVVGRVRKTCPEHQRLLRAAYAAMEA